MELHGQAGGIGMIHRMFQYPANWTWQLLQQPQSSETADDPIVDIRQQLPECMDWLEQSQTSTFSYFRTQEQRGQQHHTISGSLYILLSEDPADSSPFHYYLSGHDLVTYHEELRLPIKLQSWTMTEQYKQCSSAAEAFVYMLSTLSEPIQKGLEQFTKQLAELELAIHANKSSLSIDQVIAYRSKLVQWEQIFVPTQQLLLTIQQLFQKQLQTSDIIQHTLQKWNRLDELMQRYKVTVDHLITMTDSLQQRQRYSPWKLLLHVFLLLLPTAIAVTLAALTFDNWVTNIYSLWSLPIVLVIIVIMITTLLYRRLIRQRTSASSRRIIQTVAPPTKQAQRKDAALADHLPSRRAQRK